VPFKARRTTKLTQVLRQVAFAVSAEVAARVLSYLNIQVSGDTVLRVLRNTTMPPVTTPRVLGVDDWAMKKGRIYGTILVDQEAHQVIELLPDRSADTLEKWLQNHPGIEIVTRDRSHEYKVGIDAGAPDTIQIADRWHLLKNLREMLERYLQAIYKELQSLPVAKAHRQVLQPTHGPFYRTKRERAASQASRERRLAAYQYIRQLRHDGYTITQIANMMGLNRKTVSKYYQATVFPERKQRNKEKSMLDPHLPYLSRRLNEGCQNAMQLWREIQVQGFAGSSIQVWRWVQAHRTDIGAGTSHEHRGSLDIGKVRQQYALPTLRSLAWLLVRNPEDLTDKDTAILQHLQQHAELTQVYQLAQQFRTMVKVRNAVPFDAWLATCLASSIAPVKHFAVGLQQDYAAVKAALLFEWSNGQTEGQVNRLKCIKRQMYGRANFDLLRLHVLGPP
jgi:transposase